MGLLRQCIEREDGTGRPDVCRRFNRVSVIRDEIASGLPPLKDHCTIITEGWITQPHSSVRTHPVNIPRQSTFSGSQHRAALIHRAAVKIQQLIYEWVLLQRPAVPQYCL
jgi:hypothetical protein